MNENTTTTGIATDEDKAGEYEALQKAATEATTELERLGARLLSCRAQLLQVATSLDEASGSEYEKRLRELAIGDDEITINPVDTSALTAKAKALKIIIDELEKAVAYQQRQKQIFVSGIVRIESDLYRDQYIAEAVDAINSGRLQEHTSPIIGFFVERGVTKARAQKMTDKVFLTLARQKVAV